MANEKTPGPKGCARASTNGKAHVFSALTTGAVNCKRCLAWMVKHPGFTVELYRAQAGAVRGRLAQGMGRGQDQ